MIRRLLALWRDCRGVAAVEFGVALPVMVVMFCGMYEISAATITYMKVIDAADTVVDLAGQYKTVSSSDIDNFYLAGKMVMQPDSGAALGLAIASVTFDATTGNPSVAWQVTRGGAAAMTDAASAATNLGSKGDSVLVTQATYTYTSILKYLLPNGLTITSRVFTRPRLVSAVPCTSPCS